MASYTYILTAVEYEESTLRLCIFEVFCVYFVNSRLGSIRISVCSTNGLLEWWHRHSSQNHFNIQIDIDFPNRLRLQPSALRFVWIFNLSFQLLERWCFTFRSMHYYITLTVIHNMHLHTFHCQWQCKGTKKKIIKNSKFIGHFKDIYIYIYIHVSVNSTDRNHLAIIRAVCRFFSFLIRTCCDDETPNSLPAKNSLRIFPTQFPAYMFFFLSSFGRIASFWVPHTRKGTHSNNSKTNDNVYENFNYPNDKIV